MKIFRIFAFFFLLISIVGCRESHSKTISEQTISFHGRTANLPPVYRARVPTHWVKKQIEPTNDLQDTTLPIAEFTIPDPASANYIRITIHNFPKNHLSESISITAASQVARWQKQFTKSSAIGNPLVQESYGGFIGLHFDGSGTINEKLTSMLAWAMSLAQSHDSTLRTYQYYHPEKAAYINEMRADYTIKAMGSPDLMAKHRHDIINFAHSFELVEEIPTP